MKASSFAMYRNNYTSPAARRVVSYARGLSFGWTLILLFSCWISYHEHHATLNKIAIAEARAAIGRDLLYRRWGAMHGGVYVPPTATTPPNPYLSHIPSRDLTTTDGKKLTLINPAYMTRQVYELAQQSKTPVGNGHLTSLKPIRPENAPDRWETSALQKFERGITEVSEIIQQDGQTYMRLMKPFSTEQSCLKCHADQGYKVGDIRGGLSVTIPIQPLVDATHGQIYASVGSHGCIWLLGLLLAIAGAGKLSRSAQTQQELTDELYLQAEQLEEEIAERQQAQEDLAVKQQQLEVLNRELTERIATTVVAMRQKDQLLIQQGRLAAMGEMINNIAHQWRQPLNNVGLIIQNLQLSHQDGKLSSQELDSGVENAMKTIVHMSRTIDDFRNFFRQDKEKVPFHVDSIVRRTLDFIAATLENRGIRLTCECEQNVETIGFPNEYSQVLLNIIANARDVLVERNVSDPWIDIRVRMHGERSQVTIRDNGGGIAYQIMPKIFDPYFTTKEPDKGSGIGLYMSKIIIEQNMGGQLTAHNLSDGAEFTIEL